MEIKKWWKKFWHLLWKDDSLKGWIFSLVFLYIFIKLIFFPGLEFITGTTYPMAIVESCSMYHSGLDSSDPNEWWEYKEKNYKQFNITKEQFQTFSLHNGFNKGDILFVVRANPEKLKIGDIIIFNAGQQYPLIHRIIKITETENGKIFSTWGDNNNGQLSVELEITEDQLIGKAKTRLVPYAGWAKLIFYEFFRHPSERGFCKQN